MHYFQYHFLTHSIKPKPRIDSSPQPADPLLAQLVLLRLVAGAIVEPFAVTYPVASLAVASRHRAHSFGAARGSYGI